MSEQLILIKTLEELANLKTLIGKETFISFDTETTGLSKDAEIIGFSVSSDVNTGYYVILKSWDVATQTLVTLPTMEMAKDFLGSLIGKSLIMHNGLFDCYMVANNFNIKLMDSLHTDTMILAHLLNENRAVGLKELGLSIFGEDANKEQLAMKASIAKNGGVCTKAQYELYKADADIIGYYGAKDAVLTTKLFYHLVPELYDQGLEKFFYEDESMPLLRGPTYDLNTSGLRIDSDSLTRLKGTLQAECMDAKAFIYKEIEPYVKEQYPGTKPSNTFNIGGSTQLSWLLFHKLGKEFLNLTDGGKELCKALNMRIPYSFAAKREFIRLCIERKGEIYDDAKMNLKTKKMGRPKKIRDPWAYIACGKETIAHYASTYKWCAKLLEYSRNLKLLNTYVEGIQTRAQYSIIYPSFLQHGTTSGRYSSRNPNFQNLPRKDKRIKACIVARPGKVFVGADYSQLEPRVFASFSKDEPLLRCFASGEDFYSVIGAPVYGKSDLPMVKDAKGSFAELHPDLRDNAKIYGLSATYGTTAFKMSKSLKCSVEEADEVIEKYFTMFPGVYTFMMECHETVKREGKVVNLFGRPRRIPEATEIPSLYGKTQHANLPAHARNLLNLAVNHPVQGTGASIMNRSAIAFYNSCRQKELVNPLWKEVRVVLQVHDELVAEGPKELEAEMIQLLKYSMENTVILPGVALIAEPKGGNNLADLK